MAPEHDKPDAAGLTSAEVAERVARDEVNSAPSRRRSEYGEIVARNLFTLFNALVVPAAVALFLLGDYRAAWAVSAMAVINMLISLIQELRAKRHLDKLAILAEPRACVRRDGQESTIPAGDIVRDDLIRLAAGEAVVVDGPVVTARYLEVDEALLTGESDPVPRRPGERLLSGSVCVAGEGSYRAERVGGEGFAQRLAAEARQYRYAPSPMQRVLDALIRVLTAIAIALCALYVVLYYARGFQAESLWQMIAATVTSMVPQGLVLMATLAFTLGALRLSARGAVVQRLSAVESMASIDVLCLDKTGTLTTNRLALDRVRPAGVSEVEARDRLRVFASASLDAANKTIAALRAALGDVPIEVIEQLPFKSQNRFSAVRVRDTGGEKVLVLGAFEALAPRMNDRADAESLWRELLSSGLRLLLFAEGSPAAALDSCPLRPLAVVALSDELRPEAGPVLGELAAQGIELEVISGDNPETVRATIAHLPPALAQKISVFGRVTPHQKLDIVKQLQDRGRAVAMVGDGVNDVLPIKRADLGIAMGAGTCAARTVAGLVLETNDFTLLPQALAEGRAIVHNLRRAAKLFLLKNVFTLLLIIAGLELLGLEFPYLPQQVTLLNVLTIGGPAFLIVLGRSPVGRPVRRGFLREVGVFALLAGSLTAAAALAVWITSAARGDSEELQRTLLLTTLILTGLGNVLLIAGGDRRLFAWVALALPAYIGVMYLPPPAYFFALQPLSAGQWLQALLAAGAALLLTLLTSRAGRSQ
jgi:cation-transporting ATPase E